jgi:hypothetical protein
MKLIEIKSSHMDEIHNMKWSSHLNEINQHEKITTQIQLTTWMKHLAELLDIGEIGDVWRWMKLVVNRSG